MAMYSHVTHPNARRWRGWSALCAPLSEETSRLEDTVLGDLRPGVHAEVGEQGRGDVGDAAWRREAEADGEDVGVVGVEGPVVTLLVEVSIDLAEGVARGRREDDVSGAGRSEERRVGKECRSR